MNVFKEHRFLKYTSLYTKKFHTSRTRTTRNTTTSTSQIGVNVYARTLKNEDSQFHRKSESQSQDLSSKDIFISKDPTLKKNHSTNTSKCTPLELAPCATNIVSAIP